MLFFGCSRSEKKTDQEAAIPQAAVQVLERKVGETVPSFVSDALKKVPLDALVGVGTAKMASMSMSRTVAATRARADIARQINQVVVEMVRNYSVVSETDPNAAHSFQERITVAISKADLPATSVIDEGMDDAGNYWAVVMLSKESLSGVITQAQNQAAGDFPRMSSFNIGSMLNDAIESIAKMDITVAR